MGDSRAFGQLRAAVQTHLTRRSEDRAVRTALADPLVGPEMRALWGAGSRREARDRHAISVLLAATLARDAHTVDVGAHSGSVLREMVRIAPDGDHIAYEPIPEMAAHLTAAFPGVTVRNAALSNETGETSFVHVDSAPEFSGLRERDYHGFDRVEKHEIRVRTERLDDCLPEAFAPSFIKIDVEGAELLVLEGALETLRQFRPTVLFEHGIGAAEHYGTRPGDVYDLLVGDLRMRLFDLDGRGPYTRQEFEAVFAEPIWNFLAVS